jgi:hypothetical protein
MRARATTKTRSFTANEGGGTTDSDGQQRVIRFVFQCSPQAGELLGSEPGVLPGKQVVRQGGSTQHIVYADSGIAQQQLQAGIHPIVFFVATRPPAHIARSPKCALHCCSVSQLEIKAAEADRKRNGGS